MSGKWAEGTVLVLAQQAHSMFTWIAEEVLRDWGGGGGQRPLPKGYSLGTLLALAWGPFCPQRLWQCLEIFLVGTVRGKVLLVPGG